MFCSTSGCGLRPPKCSAKKTPCAKPRCASCKPGTMSPTAYTPGTLVIKCSSTGIKPRSRLIPTCSKPISRVRGARPTATSNKSASKVSPAWVLTCTASWSWVTESNKVPVLKTMPRLRKARSRPLDTAASSLLAKCGSASITVTSVPKDAHRLANSIPITPPPRTIALRGIQSSCSA